MKTSVVWQKSLVRAGVAKKTSYSYNLEDLFKYETLITLIKLGFPCIKVAKPRGWNLLCLERKGQVESVF